MILKYVKVLKICNQDLCLCRKMCISFSFFGFSEELGEFMVSARPYPLI